MPGDLNPSIQSIAVTMTCEMALCPQSLIGNTTDYEVKVLTLIINLIVFITTAVEQCRNCRPFSYIVLLNSLK